MKTVLIHLMKHSLIKLLLVGALSASSASGAIVITAQEVGNDLVLTSSGSANVQSLSLQDSDSWPYGGYVTASSDTIVAGPAAAVSMDFYLGISEVATLGSANNMAYGASEGSGQSVGILQGVVLAVPSGYTSGSTITATSTFSDLSLTELGIAPGDYTWSWGTGPSADSLTFTAVPEPATYAAIAGVLALGLAFWRRRQR